MPHVVCQVIATNDKVSFTWSEGAGSFEPYHPTGQCFADFRTLALQARARLSDVVKDYLRKPDQKVFRPEATRSGRRRSRVSSSQIRLGPPRGEVVPTNPTVRCQLRSPIAERECPWERPRFTSFARSILTGPIS